jgi:HEAT repeat protein
VTGLLQRLSGGDRRSIGAADEVVAEVLEDLELFGVVFEGMLDDDPVVRMRAADVAEKVSAEHPECLAPYKARLLAQVAASEQQEVRWHVAQMLPRLALSAKERDAAVSLLLGYLEDKSKIVKTFSMQALADLALRDERLRPRVVPVLQALTATGSPAMKSRGRRLLEDLMKR